MDYGILVRRNSGYWHMPLFSFLIQGYFVCLEKYIIETIIEWLAKSVTTCKELIIVFGDDKPKLKTFPGLFCWGEDCYVPIYAF